VYCSCGNGKANRKTRAPPSCVCVCSSLMFDVLWRKKDIRSIERMNERETCVHVLREKEGGTKGLNESKNEE